MGDTDGAQHKRCGNRPCEEMDDKIIEELRAFIGQRYASFMTSTLTFRHLKQHLSDTLGIPYETLGLPDGRYGETLDDEVDRIAVRCDGGARDVACVATPGYVPPKPFIRVHHVFSYGALVVAAIVLFRKRPRRRAVDQDRRAPLRRCAERRRHADGAAADDDEVEALAQHARRAVTRRVGRVGARKQRAEAIARGEEAGDELDYV